MFGGGWLRPVGIAMALVVRLPGFLPAQGGSVAATPAKPKKEPKRKVKFDSDNPYGP